MKPTKFMTSAQDMVLAHDRRCDGSHTHQHPVGGRATEAALYSLPLERAILKGIRDAADAQKNQDSGNAERRELVHAIAGSQGETPYDHEKPVEVPSSYITNTDGGKVRVSDDEKNFKHKHIDEYTGETPEPSLIRAAIAEELN